MSYAPTPHQDRLIQEIYAAAHYGERRRLMDHHQAQLEPMDRREVYRHAALRGYVTPLRKPKQWSEAEMELLERHAHKQADTIAGIFRRAGYSRTVAAIGIKLKRELGGFRQARQDAGYYTACQAGELLGAASRSVTYWIEKGWLKAKRGAVHGSTITHQIKVADLRNFVIHHPGYVNLAKVDKYAFIDLLCPSHGAKDARALEAA